MAKRNTGASARSRKKGDDTYNARRRERRAAERYLKKAESSSGATREKNLQLAKQHFERALDTYDPATKQDFSAPMKRIAAAVGADINKRRGEFATGGDRARKRQIAQFEARREKVIRQSFGATETAMADAERRAEQEARIIMGSDVGKRIMAGLVDVWSDYVSKDKTAEENRAAAQKAIFEYFDTDKWADVVAAIEESVGDALYKMGGQDDFYDVVKTTIQDKVMDNTLIV